MSGVQSIPPRKNLGVSSTSEPPLKLAAPDISGLTLEQAKVKIIDSGFRYDIDYLIDDTRTDGIILGQYPPPETLRRENGKIKIQVNSRSSSIMPDLIGKTEAEATSLLQDLQIAFQITRIDTPQAAYANKIFYQSSPYGTILARNVATVNLSLGNYVPATIGSLPSVLGLTYDLALQQMSVAGFSNIQRVLDTSNTIEYQTKNNTVKEQFPAGGQTASFTQIIQLKTYAYSGIVVPNLSGLTVTEAQSQLSALGLNYSVGTSVNTSNSTLGNKVSSQSPAAGSTVVSGSTVTYNYYTYVYVAPTPAPVPPTQSYPNISGATAYGAGAGQAWTTDAAYITWSGSGFDTFSIVLNGVTRATGTTSNGPPVYIGGLNAGTNYSGTVTLNAAGYPSASTGVSFTTASAAANPTPTPSPSGGGTPTPTPAEPTPTPTPIEPIAVFPIDIPPIDFPIGVSPATGKSVGINTLVRTPDGLVAAKDLRVGDTLISADINTFPTEGFSATDLALAWKDSTPDISIVNTTIDGISRKMSSYAVVINNDLFSDSHYILAKRNGEAQFVKSLDIESSDLIYSYQDSDWVEITTLEKVQVEHEIISINCEPYDIFFTENMLTHDSHSV